MTYNFNGKNIVIHDAEIDKLMRSLGIDKQEAIDLWLADNGYEINEEQINLDKKASKVQIDVGAEQKKTKKTRKKPEIKVSDEKQALFNGILEHLTSIYGENVKILNENKLISVEINGISFKIDIIQSRKPKTA